MAISKMNKPSIIVNYTHISAKGERTAESATIAMYTDFGEHLNNNGIKNEWENDCITPHDKKYIGQFIYHVLDDNDERTGEQYIINSVVDSDDNDCYHIAAGISLDSFGGTIDIDYPLTEYEIAELAENWDCPIDEIKEMLVKF